MNFVKAAVLTSTDGIDFQEEAVEGAVRTGGDAGGRTLYEQLKANRDIKQEEYDAKRRELNGAPKALDDEDVAHLENVASLRRHEAKRNQEEEARALEQFAQQRMARKSQAKDPRPAEGGAPARQREAPTLPKMSGKRRPGGGLATLRVIKKPKQVRERKAEDGEGAGTVGNNRDAADAGEAYAAPAASNGEGVGGILGYVAYSDSDSDSDSNSGDDGDDGGGSDKAEQKGKT